MKPSKNKEKPPGNKGEKDKQLDLMKILRRGGNKVISTFSSNCTQSTRIFHSFFYDIFRICK